ncbi:MAG: hypothetical protein QOJ52_4289, partial [Acidimicrobiaceae bacterium]|nr:hypothetical protein [Acidimicrobiaceae bacterium]
MSDKHSQDKAEQAKPSAQTENPDKEQLGDDQLDQVTGGSQSTGAGAGKVTFNPFSITRKI